MSKSNNLRQQVEQETALAMKRVYDVGSPTPIQHVDIISDANIFLKREDISPINAYKWRGAYNKIKVLSETESPKFIVAASAGNHAQGVALAANELNIKAKIFMPVSTPKMKQVSVKKLGKEWVEIVLVGDTYNEAAEAAANFVKENDLPYIHPYDDLYTIAGQATIGEEILSSDIGSLDYVFLQIGGGGMAAGVATSLKKSMPNVKIIGVEGVDQASMKTSIKNDKITKIKKLDAFCDGTAVHTPGTLNFEICKELLDDVITVTNEEVCGAIQTMWEEKRSIPEPSGAMSLAGLIKSKDMLKNKKALAVICGANMDFGQLRRIARQSAIGYAKRKYFRFELGEKKGSLLNILEEILFDVSITEFQYGKIDPEKGWPVIAFEAGEDQLQEIKKRLQDKEYAYEDVTSNADTEFRIINYNPKLFNLPFFMRYDFPERAGALKEFLESISSLANICYFNYAFSGEFVGHTLIGLEFENESSREQTLKTLTDLPINFQEIEEETANRILKTI